MHGFNLYKDAKDVEVRDSLTAMCLLAQIYQYQGRLNEAEAVCIECLNLRSGALGIRDRKTLNAMHLLARTYDN